MAGPEEQEPLPADTPETAPPAPETPAEGPPKKKIGRPKGKKSRPGSRKPGPKPGFKRKLSPEIRKVLLARLKAQLKPGDDPEAVSEALVEIEDAITPAAEKRGPKPVPLSNEQRGGIVTLLEAGCGRVMACKQVGCGYTQFLKTMAADGEYAKDVLAAETYAEEFMVTVLHNAGQHANLQGANSFLNHKHRSRQWVLTLEETRFRMRLSKALFDRFLPKIEMLIDKVCPAEMRDEALRMLRDASMELMVDDKRGTAAQFQGPVEPLC
jgi:hypothetical protein